jgi:hypothetical protein
MARGSVIQVVNLFAVELVYEQRREIECGISGTGPVVVLLTLTLLQ